MSSHEKVQYTAKPLGKHPPHYENLVHTPGRRLMHDVRLEFVKKKVHGGGHRGVAASLNLTSMIDYLVTVVIFLLMSFSASGETPMDKNVTLPSAQNASDMVTAPIVAVNGKQILVDGKPIGSTQNVEESGRVNPRIDELYTVLKTLKDDWKKLNPGKGEHPGVVLLQIDKGVKALVVKSVFQTAASAGYPNVGFMVGQIPKSSGAAPAELSIHLGPLRPGAFIGAPAANLLSSCYPPAMSDERPRGLSAIRETRDLRAARKATPTASGQFWLWSLVGIAALTVFYWKKTESEAEGQRARVLTKQRVIAETISAQYIPLRDRLEGWTQQIANDPSTTDDLSGLNEGEKPASLLAKPGVYLRLLQPNATSPEKIRANAVGSLKDAFVACFLRTSQVVEHTERECKLTRDCKPGEVCSELGTCSPVMQPFNLRVASRGLRMLSDDWIKEVQIATDPLRLRMFESDIEDASVNDLPLAIDLIKQAKYFLVVIDEVPPEVKATKETSLEQETQATIHPTRVALFDLTTGKRVFKMRRTIDVPIPITPGAIDAQRRQVLNCTLGGEVRSTIGL